MPDSTFLARLGPPLRRAILRHYTADSCVASSAIGKLVLDQLGFDVRPLSVRAMLANQPFVARAEREQHMPHSREETERWFIESGAHALGLGVPDPHDTRIDPSVNGLHVVLLVNDTWLWDLSIDQASRPQHGIVINEPFVGDVSRSRHRKRWLRGQTPILWSAPGQGIVTYIVKPHDTRYEQHTNWRIPSKDSDTRQAIAVEALSALKALYGLAQQTNT